MAKYSFVVPVHNGGEHIRQCINSALQQTFTDFDIVVLENVSTDGTKEWLENLDDPRITVLPSQSLLPIQDNWARIKEVPRGEYMTILPADDLVDADFLVTFEDLIERFPNSGLYHAHFRLIDGEGREIRKCGPRALHETPEDFLTALLVHSRETFATGYVFRSADYDAVGGIPGFEKLLYADFALWLLLMEKNGVTTSPHECFSFRIHEKSTTSSSGAVSYLYALSQFQAFLTKYKERVPSISAVLSRGLHRFLCKHSWNWYYILAKENLLVGNRVAVFRYFLQAAKCDWRTLFTKQWLYLVRRWVLNDRRAY